jgi:hypothetical protein
MAGWVDMQVDRSLCRLHAGRLSLRQDGRRRVQAVKVMTKNGEPLDAETEERLREQPGDNFEPYKGVHSGVARTERVDQWIKRSPASCQEFGSNAVSALEQ